MTQLQQSVPQVRAAGGMNIYQQEGSAESRGGMMGLSEMPPPMFNSGSGRGMNLASTLGGDTMPGMPTAPLSMGMGIPHPGGAGAGAQLPSPSGGNIAGRGWGGGLDQYGRQRDGHGR